MKGIKLRKILLGFILLLMANTVYAGKGKVRITSDQEGAYIYVDGKKKAMTGEGFTSILLEEGEYNIKVLKETDGIYEYLDKKRVFVGEDTSTKIKFRLSKKIKSEVKTRLETELEEYKKTIPQKDAQKLKRWVRKGNLVIDTKLKLMWQDDMSVKKITKNWKGANKYCQKLIFALYNDWRLPDHKELLSIVDYDRYDPAIVPSFKNVASAYYMSSTMNVNYSDYPWHIYFKNGYMYNTGSYPDRTAIRCVR